MSRSMKQTLFLIAFGVILFALVNNIGSVVGFFGNVATVLLPVSIGLLCAFILNVPMNGLEKIFNRIFAKAKHKPKRKALHLISLLLTLLMVLAVLTALSTMVIPQAVKTIKSVVELIEQHWPEWVAFLDSKGINTALLTQLQEKFDLSSIVDKVTSNVTLLVGSIANAASATVSTVTSVVFGIIISLYVLLEKDSLAIQSKKLLYAFLRPKAADYILRVATLMKDSYARFLSGQCVEACILAVLMFFGFLIFGLPYPGLVALATAVCALIPYIGALISCALAVILTLLVNPAKVLICLAVYLAIQFVENQFIYPHVVGGSVGLSPLWTLVAVIIGGNLFGLIGMILFIPLTAVISELLRDSVNKRLEKRQGSEKPPNTDA